MLKKISLKAVILSNLAGLIYTIIYTALSIYYISVRYYIADTPQPMLHEKILTLTENDIFISASIWIVGGIIIMLGGYYAGRLARHNHLLNATLASLIYIILDLYALALDKTTPIHQTVQGLILPPLLALAGGYLYLKSQPTPKPKNTERKYPR